MKKTTKPSGSGPRSPSRSSSGRGSRAPAKSADRGGGRSAGRRAAYGEDKPFRRGGPREDRPGDDRPRDDKPRAPRSSGDRPFKKDFKGDFKKGPRKEYGRDDDKRSFRKDSPRGGARKFDRDAPRSEAKEDRGPYKSDGRKSFDKKPYDKKPYGDKKFGDKKFERDYSPKPRGSKAYQADANNKGKAYDTDAARESRPRKVSHGPRPNMFGLHAVREAWLNPKRSVHALYLSEQAALQMAAALAQAERKGIGRPEPKVVTKEELDSMVGENAVHQGAAISAAPLEEVFLQDILSMAENKPKSVILVLDQVTDPHNVGAILRSASAFGADGVIMQRRHAPELEGVLCKTASGAVEHLPVAYETNLSRTLEELQEAGYTVLGLDEHAEQSLGDVKSAERVVLVLGNEGDGMRRLVREHCDTLVRLPTGGPIASLNVSNAAAIALYALLA